MNKHQLIALNCDTENDCSNSFEVPDTVFENEGGSKKDSSVDPFGLYSLLNKKTNDQKHKESGTNSSPKFPPGFTPNNDNDDTGDKKSVNDFEEEKLNEDDGDSNNSNLKENVDESASFGRFKKSVAPMARKVGIWGLHEDPRQIRQILTDHRPILLMKSRPMIMVRFPSDSFTIGFISRALMISSLQLGILPLLLTLMECVTWRKELNQLDAVIDKGTGTEVEAEKRMEVLAALRNIDHIHSMDFAQKAKIKWSIEGDKTKFFPTRNFNKKRNQMNIRGITIDALEGAPNGCQTRISFSFSDSSQNLRRGVLILNMRFRKLNSEDKSQDLGARSF
ncbi:hypothetical protein Tco_0925104 [Tanacetum coccineum]|uniref:RNA-directed DNA polymerase, eukaryota n=1 Tax=Tanacetum coccineum TaxID=301880 RepID=A0ABQ5D5W1_9ASTR